MHRRNYSKIVVILFVLGFLLALTTAPLYSQGGGRGGGENRGQGQGQDHTPPGQEKREEAHTPPGQGQTQEQEQPNQAFSAEEEDSALLACQKNNPDRLDCSSLEVTGYCDGTTAVFIITNTGDPGDGDMLAATSYQLLQNGTSVQSGSVQLGGGQSTEIRYSGGGEITLIADQQIGHPGSSQPRVSLNCGAPTEEPPVTPTEEPTPEVTPTAEVTPPEEVTPDVTPTEEVIPPDLYAYGTCNLDGSITFHIENAGHAMTEPIYYAVTDSSGYVIVDGWLQLGAGEFHLVELGASYGPITLTVGDGLVVVWVECYVPTEEVTPAEPILMIFPYCDEGGGVVFDIRNEGSDMHEPVYYYVGDFDGNVVTEGWLQLAAYESLLLNLGPQSGMMTLVIGDWWAYSVNECYTSTEEPTPTEEVTPEATPTEEVTPEITPTEEVTPEVTPTAEVTPDLSCQKNNSDRLDCSSLEVTSYCEGTTAVFVITNTGEPGEGDMIQATEYRLFQNNTLIESGSVQIAGGDAIEIRYSGGGTLTLEADQQIGHPGNSLPQSTLTCGS